MRGHLRDRQRKVDKARHWAGLFQQRFEMRRIGLIDAVEHSFEVALQHVRGTFDRLVDYGVLDDLVTKDREAIY